MHHCFNLGLANEFGLNVATFLQSIAFWTHNNLANKNNLIDGNCWTYNTLQALNETFTYWSKKQLETVINNCIKAGLLVKANHNQTKYDRTCWYALTPAAYRFFPELCQEHFLQRMYDSISQKGEIDYLSWRNLFPKSETPIPDINSDIKPNNKNNISNNQLIEEIITVYHEELPELPKVKKVDSKLRIQLNKMIKDWPSYQKEGKEFSTESFRDYIRLLKTHYSWILQPYSTVTGNQVKCTLRKLTREINIAKLVNGEFSAN